VYRGRGSNLAGSAEECQSGSEKQSVLFEGKSLLAEKFDIPACLAA
jgi:hypothetical protein